MEGEKRRDVFGEDTSRRRRVHFKVEHNRSIPNDRSRKDTDRNGFGFTAHYTWTRWGGGGRIQLLFVNIQGSINLSPGQVWVSWGRGGHTGPYAAPNLLTLFTCASTYSTGRQ